jgi:hypothetical protein
VVEGRLVNGTFADAPVARQQVILSVIQQGQLRESDERTTQTDVEGRFRFEGLATGTDLRYVVEAIYQGAPHASQAFSLDAAPRTEVLRVYEVTSDTTSIALNQLSLLVSAASGSGIQVFELAIYVNSGDRTHWSTSADQHLVLPVPAGATNIQSSPGIPVEELRGGLAIPVPLPPGELQFGASYDLPETSANFELHLPYPTRSLRVLTPNGGGRVSSTALSERGEVTIGGQPFQLLEGSMLPPGPLLLEVQPAAWMDRLRFPQDSRVLSGGVLAIALGAVAFAVGYPQLVSRRGARAGETAHDVRRELLTEIAYLDDRLAAGELPQDEHLAQRTALKSRLLALTLGERDNASDAHQPRGMDQIRRSGQNSTSHTSAGGGVETREPDARADPLSRSTLDS